MLAATNLMWREETHTTFLVWCLIDKILRNTTQGCPPWRHLHTAPTRVAASLFLGCTQPQALQCALTCPAEHAACLNGLPLSIFEAVAVCRGCLMQVWCAYSAVLEHVCASHIDTLRHCSGTQCSVFA